MWPMSTDATLIDDAAAELLLALQDALIRELVAEVGPVAAGRIADRLGRSVTCPVSQTTPLARELIRRWQGRALQGLRCG